MNFSCELAKRLSFILPIVFGVIFILLYMLFRSATEATVLILPTLYAMTAACSFNTGWDSISASQHGSGISRCSDRGRNRSRDGDLSA